MYLFITAILGLFAPNGIYIYWLVTKFNTVGEALQNELAVGLFIQLVIATFVVAYRFSVSPLGKVNVRWFIAMALTGGIGFAIPAFYWLNHRSTVNERKRRKYGVRRQQQQFARLATAGV